MRRTAHGPGSALVLKNKNGFSYDLFVTMVNALRSMDGRKQHEGSWLLCLQQSTLSPLVPYSHHSRITLIAHRLVARQLPNLDACLKRQRIPTSSERGMEGSLCFSRVSCQAPGTPASAAEESNTSIDEMCFYNFSLHACAGGREAGLAGGRQMPSAESCSALQWLL